MTTYTLYSRTRVLINTDPQRRCYNGCHTKSEIRWANWEALNCFVKDPAHALAYWRELNDYAVSQRGDGARSEFKVEPNRE